MNNVIPAKAGIQEPTSPMKSYYVYILASKRNGTLYTGVTNNLLRRVWEHKNELVSGFTKKYGVHTLVYYEQTEDLESAILREKRIKKWSRKWKIRRIEKVNPNWEDLYEKLTSESNGFPPSRE